MRASALRPPRPLHLMLLLLASLCVLPGCDLIEEIADEIDDIETPGPSDNGGSTAAGEVIIRNSTSFTVTAAYLSPCPDDTWGPNDLSGTISPGNSRVWEVQGGCYDLRADFNNGASLTQFGVNTNNVSFTWTLTN